MKKPSTPVLVILVVLVLIGTGIRFFNLGDIFLYRDEPIHSVRIDYQPLAFVTAHNNGSALFAVLVHFLLGLGPVEWMARLPSAVFGSFSILAVFFAGCCFFSSRTGLLAAALVTFSPFCIQISQYSRGYSLFMFMSLLSLYYFFRAWEEDRTKLWLTFSIFTVLALYTHLMGFMLLPVYAVYAVLMWVISLFQSEESGTQRSRNRRLVRFILFTAAALFLLILLYLPDENVRGFLSGSVDRVKTQVPFTYLWSYLIQKIPSNQLQIPGRFFYVMVGFLGLGILGSLKTHAKKIALFLLYMLLPLAIFIAVNPREVNIQSADRYFIFALPVLFLLIAQGTTVAAEGIKKLLSWIKPVSSQAPVIAGTVLVVLCLWQLTGFNHRHYYLHFWRFGSHKVDSTIESRLRHEVKEDSLIFFQDFPASAHFLVINPLTQEIGVGDTELIFHAGWRSEKEQSDYMIYRSAGSLETEFASQIGVYAVPTSQSGKASELSFYGGEGVSLGQNLLRLYSDLLSQDISSIQRKEYLLMKARIELRAQQTEKAYQTLEEAHRFPLSQSGLLSTPSHPVYTLLDRLFALDPESLQSAYFDTFYFSDLAATLYALAEKHLESEEYEAAERAYQECLRLTKEHDLEVSGRFVRMANAYLVNEEPEKALPFYQEAARLNPTRQILPWLIAENYRELDQMDKALVSLNSQIPTESLLQKVKDRLAQDLPMILVIRRGRHYQLIFRAPLRARIEGIITSKKVLDEVTPEFFKKDDILEISPTEISWDFKMDKRRIKVLEFKSAKGARVELDLKLNGKSAPQHLFLLETGENPESLPFFLESIPSDGKD